MAASPKATRLDSRKTEEKSAQEIFRRAGTAEAQNPAVEGRRALPVLFLSGV